eukprot:6099807-Amphidinium_carterae.1
MLSRRLSMRTPTFVGQLDLAKAFPRLHARKACRFALEAGLPAWLVNFVETTCLKKSLQWKVAGATSPLRVPARGTPQGCAMSVMAFQLLLAPVVRAIRLYLQARCPASRVVVYADDIVFLVSSATLLGDLMAYSVRLLESLDFQINISKSAVSIFGASSIPDIIINNEKVPAVQHPDVLGCTIPTSTAKLAAPSALSTTSTSRTVLRWQKLQTRLGRLERLKTTEPVKRSLWRSVILPILSYDCWTLMPNKSTASAWSSLVCKSIYTNVRGRKCRQLLFATNPHQLEISCVLLHFLAKEALVDVLGEPLAAFFQVEPNTFLHTPLSAFVHMAVLLGFEMHPEGLLNVPSNILVDWPPTSMDHLLHQLREAMRGWILTQAEAPIDFIPGDKVNPKSFVVAPQLSRTQLNFLSTLQSHAHQAKDETTCPLCGQRSSITHAVWECEARPLNLLLKEPVGSDRWPKNFKSLALLNSREELSVEDIHAGQDFMTRVLIDRRRVQLQLADPTQPKKRRRLNARPTEESCQDDVWHQRAAADIIDITDEEIFPEFDDPGRHTSNPTASLCDAPASVADPRNEQAPLAGESSSSTNPPLYMRIGAEPTHQQTHRANGLQSPMDPAIDQVETTSAPPSAQPAEDQPLVILVPDDEPRPVKRP